MKTAIFSTHKFEKEYYVTEATDSHDLLWIEAPLCEATVLLAQGCKAICIFANDDASEKVIRKIRRGRRRIFGAAFSRI